MTTEITDKNAKESVGWIFYDAECAFCARGVKRWNYLFSRRGYCWMPLQTSGTAERLGISESSLREEMKLLLADGRIAGGVDAWVLLFRSVWWLWPMGVLLNFPGVHWFAKNFYRWIARNRYCFGGKCELHEHRSVHHRHSVFFEMP